ncbi:MAG TPA: hypothetical protein VFV10_15880 [Gammaproteobacteria bacterium]|nr:hypothetical protein [Gammaproteobacteria bacterium]
MSEQDELRQRLAAMQGPTIAKASPSLRTRSEERAVEIIRLGLEASELSQRGYGRRLTVCERIVRDYLSGARAVPLWALIALPRKGQLAAVRALLEAIPAESEDDPDSRRGAA